MLRHLEVRTGEGMRVTKRVDVAVSRARGLDLIGRREKSELLGWIDDPNARRQVVSTTVDPLFSLVGRGLFDEALYYRLNVILLCVEWDARRNN